MYTKEEIYNYLKDILIENFEVEPDDITPSSKLYEELDIDSIDAVDMVIQLKKFTKRRMQPADFKDVRTVDDVVNAVFALLESQQEDITEHT